MQMINCHECNSEISSTAKSCPKCGAVTKNSELIESESNYTNGAILGLALLVYSAAMSATCLGSPAQDSCMQNKIDNYFIGFTFWFGLIAFIAGVWGSNKTTDDINNHQKK